VNLNGQSDHFSADRVEFLVIFQILRAFAPSW
jgi:hypothetical protein